MSRRLALFTLLLATQSSVAALSPRISSASDDLSLCFGQVPTIVGNPGEIVRGTDGPDVVLSNGARHVDTRRGDDLICVSGIYSGEDFDEYHDGPRFQTGAGRDRIDTSSTNADVKALYLYVLPGRGSDQVIGGPSHREEVVAGTEDVVDLGGGTDTLHLYLHDAAGGIFKGGVGATLAFHIAQTDQHSWKADNRSGRITRQAQRFADFVGFSRFELHVRGNFSFAGSDADETLSMHFNRRWTGSSGASDIRVHMESGDDRVFFSGSAPGSWFDGGNGVDRFVYDAGQMFRHTSVIFNMTSGRLKDTWPTGQATTRRVTHFEAAVLSNGQHATAGPITVKGTSAANWIKVRGPGSSTIYGKAGDDDMRGGTGDSVLVGGDGLDVAYGEWGIDICEAEIQHSCESDRRT